MEQRRRVSGSGVAVTVTLLVNGSLVAGPHWRERPEPQEGLRPGRPPGRLDEPGRAGHVHLDDRPAPARRRQPARRRRRVSTATTTRSPPPRHRPPPVCRRRRQRRSSRQVASSAQRALRRRSRRDGRSPAGLGYGHALVVAGRHPAGLLRRRRPPDPPGRRLRAVAVLASPRALWRRRGHPTAPALRSPGPTGAPRRPGRRLAPPAMLVEPPPATSAWTPDNRLVTVPSPDAEIIRGPPRPGRRPQGAGHRRRSPSSSPGFSRTVA